MEDASTGPGRWRLLLTEDDPGIRRMLRMAFGREGFLVTEAESGVEAVEALNAGGIDAVVLDLGLAGLRSADVLAWLHANGDSPPWLVISAVDQADATHMDPSIEGRFLAKPFEPAELIARLSAELGT